MNTILLNILIIIIIIFIIYLCVVLYRNFYKNKINNETIVNNINENFDLSEIPSVQTIETSKNLLMKIGYNDTVYDIELKLYDNELPFTCKNFRTIAKKGINNKKYNNSIFH